MPGPRHAAANHLGMRLRILLLAVSVLLPGGAAVARPPQAIVYEDPDDSEGPLDVLSVSRTQVGYAGRRHYEHRIDFQERWDDDYVAGSFLLSSYGFEHPSWCDDDDCTGDWEGTIYEDDEGRVRAELWALDNCNDCQGFEIPAEEDAQGDLLLRFPRKLLFPGTDYYLLRLQTHFENTFRANAEPRCRLPVCDDYVPDGEEGMRFPVGR